MSFPAVMAVLVAFGLAVSTLGVFLTLKARDERRRLLARIGNGDRGHDGDLRRGGPGARLAGLTHLLGRAARPRDEGEVSRVRTLFLRAGVRSEGALGPFFGMKVLLAALFPACLLIAGLAVPLRFALPQMTALALLLSAAGFYAPDLWLRSRIARRKEKLTSGFPEALDLLVVCAEAGMGLDAALKRVGAEMALSNEAVSDEFRVLNLELRAGKSRADALRNLALRTDIEDVGSLVSLLIQADRFGTSIGEALRVQADAMRTRRAQKAEETASRLPVKLLFPTIFCIFPSVLVVILGPALIQALKGLGR